MSSFRRFAGLALVALTFVLAPGIPAFAAGDRAGKLDTVVRQRARQLTGRTRVIVEFNTEADVRVLGHGAGRRLGARAQAAEMENRSLAALQADPRVRRVMLDRPVFPTLERTGAAIGALAVRERLGLTGQGVGVAVIDSGVSAHADLDGRGRRSRIAHFRDFTRDTGARWFADRPSDEYGHGTHVAGIIAGDGGRSAGRRSGIAPGAHIVGLKVLDGEGHGYISDVIAAIDYAVAARAAYNIRVINLSVASGVFESYRQDPLALAARRAVDAGIVVVAAAGNLGRGAAGQPQFGGITSPGNAPWVLTVGASSHTGTARRSDDTVADFSSRGPTWIDFAAKPDLLAPGVGIESLAVRGSSLTATYGQYLVGGTRGAPRDSYLSLSGTSMAAPAVAGTIALMIEANPALTPNAVKAILQYTAQAGRSRDALAQGAGLLNARGAVRLARFFSAPAAARLGAMRDSIEGESIPWARHIIWGNYLVKGGLPLPGSSAWESDLPWGALQTRSGQPVVWGARTAENIVWSTGEDENIVWSTSDDENIVWSTDDDSNIVWSTNDDGNIVWSVETDENIVWSTAVGRNVVWGNDCGGRNCARVVWGTRSASRVWGAVDGDFNIVWSTFADENIVWSTGSDGNIVWSTGSDGNIVWSTSDDWNIVWSTGLDENIVWSTGTDENIVWSTGTDENIVWSTGLDENIVWSTAFDENIVWSTRAADQVLWPAAAPGNRQR